VIERRQPLITRANTERDIRDAVAFGERTGVRIVISGGAEAQLAAQLLREKNIPVILGSVLTLPSRQDLPHQSSYAVASELARAGGNSHSPPATPRTSRTSASCLITRHARSPGVCGGRRRCER